MSLRERIRRRAKLLTKDEARRIAANIAKLAMALGCKRIAPDRHGIGGVWAEAIAVPFTQQGLFSPPRTFPQRETPACHCSRVKMILQLSPRTAEAGTRKNSTAKPTTVFAAVIWKLSCSFHFIMLASRPCCSISLQRCNGPCGCIACIRRAAHRACPRCHRI